jgi:ribosome biogenesis GTPase / thiamine phosphate phosphatase
MITGVVLGRQGGTLRVYADGRDVTASLRGKLKFKDDDRVVAGDVVELELHGEDEATIVAIQPRRSVLARRAPGGARRQPVAANIDQVVVVTAAQDPQPNPRTLDRFLVVAEANRLPAAIVVNKIELDRTVGEVLTRRFAPSGYRMLATSVKAAEGLPALRDLLRGRTSVFTGVSGVGKSSLLNALEPTLGLRTGEISAYWRTGKHTTTAALLVPLGADGFVVDTPGMREVGTWGVDAESLGACFPEFRAYLHQCRFDNCRHLTEPGCAVRGAAAEGVFDADRLVSYERIYEEVSVPSWSSAKRRGR